MEYTRSDTNDEEFFWDLVEGINILGCDCLLWREKNYIYETNHDCLCGYNKSSDDFSR